MKSKLIPTFIVLVLSLGIFLGFNIGSNEPGVSKTAPENYDNAQHVYPQVFSAGTVVYVDSLNGANDTTSLKARGYKPYYRGTGAQGLTATWFQGDGTTIPAYNGPATGCVYANYNVVTGTNNIDSWLVLPRLAGGIQAGDSLYFFQRSPAANPYPDSIRVMYSANDSVPEGSWTELGRFLTDISGNYSRKGFRAPTASANGRFAIRYCVVGGGPSGNNSNIISLDMITIERTAAPAPDPTTWYEQTSGVTTALYSVSAPDINNAWIAGAGGKVLRTTNGGTWAAVTSPDANDQYCIWGISATTAITTSSSASATFVYRTTNGGTNWTQVFTQTGGFMDGFYFKDANNGIMYGDPVGGRLQVWRTTNGGANWDSTGQNITTTAAGWNNAMTGLGDNVWIGTNTTNVYKTTNFGTSWTAGTAIQANGYSLYFSSPTNGYLGGAELNTTTNGGTSWSAMTSIGTGNISGITPSNTKVFMTRQATTVNVTTNNGAAWTVAYTSPAGGNYYHITTARTGSPYLYAVKSLGGISKYGGTASGVTNPNTVVDNYSLSQNYPNPFNPTTSISFAIPQNGFVTLKVYNMLGKEVATLVNGNLNAGQHNYNFNASNLASGVYFYKLEAGNFSEVKKMSLIK
ncbi:MAG: choice-of-anchor J domain-containing protein [Bacteroidetes bacterium]|nr:choice-of-anchor J domain-containing protein [Bacteroidota bacterium]